MSGSKLLDQGEREFVGYRADELHTFGLKKDLISEIWSDKKLTTNSACGD